MKPGTIGIGIALFTLVATVKAGDWTAGTPSGDWTEQSCDCGSIPGRTGMVYIYNEPTPTGFLSGGNVGTWWSGSQFQLCAGPFVSVDNWVQHNYSRSTADGEPAQNHRLRVYYSSLLNVGGQAHQLNPVSPQWWWDSHALVADYEPVVEVFYPETGEWQSLDLEYWVYPPQTGGAESGDRPNNNNGTTSITTIWDNQGSGNAMGRASLADPDTTMARIRVDFYAEGGTSSGDNCVVDSTHYLTWSLETSLVAP